MENSSCSSMSLIFSNVQLSLTHLTVKLQCDSFTLLAITKETGEKSDSQSCSPACTCFQAFVIRHTLDDKYLFDCTGTQLHFTSKNQDVNPWYGSYLMWSLTIRPNNCMSATGHGSFFVDKAKLLSTNHSRV